ncbi:hypothetical protein MMC30_002883 [Trapelia coarctata]|nr:hypothetical protein [Trapelia coarctata]
MLGAALKGVWHNVFDLIPDAKAKCPTCLDLGAGQRIRSRPREDVLELPTGTHVSAFVQSSQRTGCPYCALIVEGIKAQAAHWIENDARLNRVCFPIGRGVKIDGPVLDSNLTFYAPKGSVPPWPALGTFPRVASHSGSPESVGRIQTWLRSCIQSHPECKSAEIFPLPKRVVYVGSNSLTDPPRLYEAGSVERTPYAALSHCWGLDQTFRTVTATLESMTLSFDLEAMPKTYRDAISLARLLSIKYIWIDSLCIIQDSAQDWEIEAAKMCDVYANAQLTIGAACAAGDKEGFLGPRPTSTKVLNFPLKSDCAQPSAIEVRYEVKHNRGHPLFFRAWVLQERLFSRRMVYFEREELVWECKHYRTCECSGLDNYRNTDWGDERPIASLARYLDNRKNDEVVYGWWKYYVLDEYNGLALTFGKDKLPALSGLAARVMRVTGDTYLAGLWAKDLALGLLWNSRQPSATALESPENPARFAVRRTPNRATAVYRGPTWSWASIDGPISHPMRPDPDEELHLQVHMHVIEAVCTPAGLDPTGAVKDGWLKVKCPVLRAKIVLKYGLKGEVIYRLQFTDEFQHIELRWDQYESPLRFKPDVPLVADMESVEGAENTARKKGVYRAEASDPVEGIGTVDDVEVKLVLIATQLFPEEKRYNRECLVLGPSKRNEPHTYERVAAWDYYNTQGKRDYWEYTLEEELVIV